MRTMMWTALAAGLLLTGGAASRADDTIRLGGPSALADIQGGTDIELVYARGGYHGGGHYGGHYGGARYYGGHYGGYGARYYGGHYGGYGARYYGGYGHYGHGYYGGYRPYYA